MTNYMIHLCTSWHSCLEFFLPSARIYQKKPSIRQVYLSGQSAGPYQNRSSSFTFETAGDAQDFRGL